MDPYEHSSRYLGVKTNEKVRACVEFAVPLDRYRWHASRQRMTRFASNSKLPVVFDSVYSFSIDQLKKECALHGDYYHLTEVWDQQNNCGQETTADFIAGVKIEYDFETFHEATEKKSDLDAYAKSYVGRYHIKIQ
jgi:hypothetical protein